MPESPFDEATLGALDRNLEIDMHTPRRDGSTSSRPIWVVVVDGEAYVRSFRGERGDWYRHAARGGRATIGSGGSTFPVTVEPVTDPELNQRISHAYRAKYEASSPGPTAAMVTDDVAATTLRLGAVPAT
ncbi:MAG TPA: DUF2255 family protein [Segeticoccus sp.]|uniref:DUF2255 family protein n=1 Tax=Segeticoccus sp. TaxID=2706531 RepID=UPI002D80C084|nr:DUF2255 family protein [Segeticoccus sp.]HET8600433.1 DUF2255 family protein [Segeticoccus sp.]